MDRPSDTRSDRFSDPAMPEYCGSCPHIQQSPKRPFLHCSIDAYAGPFDHGIRLRLHCIMGRASTLSTPVICPHGLPWFLCTARHSSYAHALDHGLCFDCRGNRSHCQRHVAGPDVCSRIHGEEAPAEASISDMLDRVHTGDSHTRALLVAPPVICQGLQERLDTCGPD